MTPLRPYTGLKVVDLSQGIAGPYCALLLALGGADVVKVEPLEGDWVRPLGTPGRAMSALFAAMNRGKRGLALDLKSAAGRAIVAALAAAADVLVENFRPGVAERLGVGYAALAAVNPGLVFVSVTGFGQAGPDRDRPATDTIMQAFLGMAAMNRDRDGAPRKVPIVPVDMATGMYAFQAAGAALYQRLTAEVAGGPARGRHLDISLLQSAAAFQAGKMLEHHLDDGDPPPEQTSPIGLYPAKDGVVAIATLRDAQFAALMAVLGLEPLVADPRFATFADRMANRAALDAEIAGRTRGRAAGELIEALAAADLLAAPVRDYAQALADPALADTGVLAWIDQPGLGRVPTINVPGTDEAALANRAAPRLGEHSAEVLAALGHDKRALGKLKKAGIVGG